MMKNKVFLLFAAVVLGFAVSSCNNDALPVAGGDPPLENNQLSGTSWTLVAFVDVENDVRREPDYGDGLARFPKDSLYTLSFGDDTLITGRIVRNSIFTHQPYIIDYNTNNLFIEQLFITLVGGAPMDEMLYYDILFGMHGVLYFELYPQALRIFYNDGKEYLEFKRIGE